VFSLKTTARMVGTFFILATTTAIIGGSLLLPLDDAGHLADLPDVRAQIVSGVLLEAVLAFSVIAIAVLMYPILKRTDEGLALGYAGIRLLESTFILVATLAALVAFSLSEATRSTDLVGAATVGDVVLLTREWAYLLGTLVVFAISALLLNSLLYRSQVVPRWLSVWGLIGGALLTVRALLEMYGQEFTMAVAFVWAGPIAIQEMVFAVWLIVKGFDLRTSAPTASDEEMPTTVP
jgi:hypothetical protein